MVLNALLKNYEAGLAVIPTFEFSKLYFCLKKFNRLKLTFFPKNQPKKYPYYGNKFLKTILFLSYDFFNIDRCLEASNMRNPKYSSSAM